MEKKMNDPIQSDELNTLIVNLRNITKAFINKDTPFNDIAESLKKMTEVFTKIENTLSVMEDRVDAVQGRLYDLHHLIEKEMLVILGDIRDYTG